MRLVPSLWLCQRWSSAHTRANLLDLGRLIIGEIARLLVRLGNHPNQANRGP
jgi:hypothetical protein